jgi:N-acyl-D-amino-acid deacylase
MSAGLTYAPGMYADDDELVALCEVVRDFDGFYCPHHRNYGSRALEAYAEQIEIARRAGVALHFAHAHLSTPANKGRAPELLALIDDAGVDVTLDTYPYLAGNTYLHALLPDWAQAGGPAEILARLSDPAIRARLRDELQLNDVRVGGRRVNDVDELCDLLVERELAVSCTLHSGNEENVRAIMQHPAHTAGSDGILVADHPRAWGTFPRYFAVYVRELGILGWEETVRKMTSLPAQRLGLSDRGLLREGMYADVTCIDPETIRDTATYEEPRRLPEGIPYVLVNGRVVVDDGRRTDELPGRAIRSQR